MREAYSPDDMIMIKKHYEKYYGPIRDNPNLTQKEKFHAAMMVLNSLNTYDHQAYQPQNQTEYSKASMYTSRNLYSSAKYGQTICAGYAENVEQICGMLGVKSKSFNVLTSRNCWDALSDKEREEVVTALKEGKKNSNHINHAVNSISFDDGSTYLLDMTNQDGVNEHIKKEGKEDIFSHYYLTDAEHFGGSLYYTDDKNNPILFSENPEDRQGSQYQMMPKEEIIAAQEKVKKELPYVAKLDQVDALKQKYTINNKQASSLHNFFGSVKNFAQNLKDRFSKANTLQLAEAHIQQENGQIGEVAQAKGENQRETFLRQLSNDGQYREMVERVALAGNSEQDKSEKQALQTDDIER